MSSRRYIKQIQETEAKATLCLSGARKGERNLAAPLRRFSTRWGTRPQGLFPVYTTLFVPSGSQVRRPPPVPLRSVPSRPTKRPWRRNRCHVPPCGSGMEAAGSGLPGSGEQPSRLWAPARRDRVVPEPAASVRLSQGPGSLPEGAVSATAPSQRLRRGFPCSQRRATELRWGEPPFRPPLEKKPPAGPLNPPEGTYELHVRRAHEAPGSGAGPEVTRA